MSTTMDKTQRILFMVLPLGFVFFIVSGSVLFPAGLLLYWVTTNLWTVGPGARDAAAGAAQLGAEPPKRSSRTPPGSGGASDGGTTAPRRQPRRPPPLRPRPAA